MQPKHCVGDSLLNCLRVVPVGAQTSNDIVLYEPDNIHYFPLRCNNIKEIEISLRNDVGDLVPFERGKCVVTFIVRK